MSEAQESKDGIELTVYKLTEKDTIAFGKVKTSKYLNESTVTYFCCVQPLTSPSKAKFR